MPQVVPAANRVLQALEVFAQEGRPLSNSELARRLELADSSCSDLLHTMREAGYVMRTPKGRAFYPTSKLGDLAQRIMSFDPMNLVASEALQMLTSRSGETSMCGLLDGSRVKIFACQESPEALRYVLRPGTMVDLHNTALGKALLGSMPDSMRSAFIDSLPLEATTATTITDRDALRREIEKGMSAHYFVANEEGGMGIFALAIAGKINDQLVSFSLVGPAHRFQANFDKHVEILLEARADFFGR
jgi:DNA-binding IclR family transcriptional regulator